MSVRVSTPIPITAARRIDGSNLVIAANHAMRPTLSTHRERGPHNISIGAAPARSSVRF